MPVVIRRDTTCKYHEGHKRVVGSGKNWHKRYKKLKGRENMKKYIVDKYGERAWHND